MSDQYFCFVEALCYIFVRNFEKQCIVQRISLGLSFPSSLKILDAHKLAVDEDSAHRDVLPTSSGNFLLGIGTKEGRVLVWRASSTSSGKHPLFSTKRGVAHGSVTAIEISPKGEDLLAGTSYGEVLHYKLLEKINE